MLFEVRSAVVLGASREEGKVGNIVLKNMKKSFKGNIYIVHPKADEILGIKCHRELRDLPEIPDMGIIALPPEKTVASIEELGRIGTKLAIAISGGFGEKGEKGKELEDKIRKISSETGIRVIGPNSVGVIFPRIGLNTALTEPSKTSFPENGKISFISQSGALGLLSMDEFVSQGVGFSSFISLGNSADLKEVEVMKIISEDSETKSFSLYLENISDTKEFLKEAKKISREKGVVILKGGLSESGSRATELHTGSLFKPGPALSGIFKQHGLVMARTETELIDASIALSFSKPIYGKNIAIVTSAGGVGVIASDLVEGAGFNVPKIDDKDARRLQELFSPLGSPYNPIDMTAEASDSQYISVMDYLDKIPYIDAVLVFTLYQTYNVTPNLIDSIAERIKGYKKPYIFGLIGGDYSNRMLSQMLKKDIPAFPSISRAVWALTVLHERGTYLRRFKK